MEQENFLSDLEQKKLPSTLNVLTILTFIGCGIGLLSSIYTFMSAEKSLEAMDKMVNGADAANMPEMMKGMINQDTLELARLQVENKIPMLVIGLVGIGLCLYGALQMRKQKMQGYYMWLIGEIFPLVASLIFLKITMFKGFGAIGLIFVSIFVILYTMQRKHLTK